MLSDIQKNQAIVDTLIRLRDEFADETSKIEEEEAVHLSKLQSANLVSSNYQSNIFSQPSVQSESSTVMSSSPDLQSDLQPKLHSPVEEGQGDVGSNQEESSLPTSMTIAVSKRPAEEVIETALKKVAHLAATASSSLSQVSSPARSVPSTDSPSSCKVKRFCHQLNRGPTGKSPISKTCEATPKSFGVKVSKPIIVSCKRKEPPVSSCSKDQSNQSSGRAASSSSSSVPLLLLSSLSTSVTPLLSVKEEPKDDYEVAHKKMKPVVGKKTSIDIIESPESTPVAVKKKAETALTPRNSKSRKGTFKTSRARRGKLKR